MVKKGWKVKTWYCDLIRRVRLVDVNKTLLCRYPLDGKCTSIVEIVTELEFRVDFFFTWFCKTWNFVKSSRCDIEAIKPKRVLCARCGVKDKKDQVGSGMWKKSRRFHHHRVTASAAEEGWAPLKFPRPQRLTFWEKQLFLLF